MRLRPDWKFEINVGVVLTVGVMVGSWIWFFSGQSQEIKTLARDFAAYTASHAEVHKEATALRTDQNARMETRITAQEQVNAQYRLTSLESQYRNTSDRIASMQSQMSEIQSDQRLANQKTEAIERKMDQMLNILTGGLPLPTTPRQQ